MDRTPQDAAQAANLGEPTARKRGRTADYPYVPVIRHTEGGRYGDGYDEQIRGKAYADRADAVAHAQAVIRHRRDHLARELGKVNMRQLRAQHGVTA
jgi:hypothetical protein